MVLDEAVAEISRSRTIMAQPQAIWDVLADFGTLSSWADGVDHSCLLHHGPDGATVGTTRRVQLGRRALVERITECTPPVTLGYDVEGLPPRLRTVANRWTLRPRGETTAVTLTSTVDIGSGPVALAAEWVVCRRMAAASDSILDGLARATEDTHD